MIFNSHSSSICIMNSVFECKNVPLPKSSSIRHHMFLVFETHSLSKSSMFSCPSVMSTKLGSTPDHKETTYPDHSPSTELPLPNWVVRCPTLQISSVQRNRQNSHKPNFICTILKKRLKHHSRVTFMLCYCGFVLKAFLNTITVKSYVKSYVKCMLFYLFPDYNDNCG